LDSARTRRSQRRIIKNRTEVEEDALKSGRTRKGKGLEDAISVDAKKPQEVIRCQLFPFSFADPFDYIELFF